MEIMKTFSPIRAEMNGVWLGTALDDGEPLPLGDTQAMEGTEPPPGAALEGGLPSGVLEAEAEA